MAPIKSLLVFLFILAGFSSFAQTSRSVFLKWKINPGEVITYKTIMKEIDTANTKLSFGFMNKLSGDSSKSNDFQNMLKTMRSLENDTNVITLKEKEKNNIDIEMRLKKSDKIEKKDTSKSGDFKNFRSLMNTMAGGAILKGIINKNGEIESFYTPNGQKNIIAVFFECRGSL